jgi:hypothetical protein
LCRHKDNTKVDHRKWDVCAWNGLNWLQTGFNGGFL